MFFVWVLVCLFGFFCSLFGGFLGVCVVGFGFFVCFGVFIVWLVWGFFCLFVWGFFCGLGVLFLSLIQSSIFFSPRELLTQP